MNVFILSTGRCGSVTFAEACKHITNYTSGHETRVHMCGEGRVEYPHDHIESDNRLSWFLGRLDKEYGDDAFYVHLVRDPKRIASSYTKRAGMRGLIMEAYKNGIYMNSSDGQQYYPFALDYVDTVTANITHFLRDKRRKMTFDIDGEIDNQFAIFWNKIAAKGEFDAALSEFSVQHNSSIRTPSSARFKHAASMLKSDIGWAGKKFIRTLRRSRMGG